MEIKFINKSLTVTRYRLWKLFVNFIMEGKMKNSHWTQN
jgi:hypothetical protein